MLGLNLYVLAWWMNMEIFVLWSLELMMNHIRFHKADMLNRMLIFTMRRFVVQTIN